MRLRPYKACDGDIISSWLTDERTFAMWSGLRYSYPMTSEQFAGRFAYGESTPTEWMMTALDDAGTPVGYFLLRSADWKNNSIHIGFIIVDNTKRGMGYGSQMLDKAKSYCRDILGMKRLTLGVFSANEGAKKCYEKAGFKAYAVDDEKLEYNNEVWECIEMECTL